MSRRAPRLRFPSFLVCLGLFAAGVLAERSGWVPGRPEPLPVLREAHDLIRRHYLDPGKLAGPELEHGAIAGMVNGLGDRGHTSFLSSDQRQRLKQGLAGRLDGIGARVALVRRRATIVQTAPGSPARSAGLRPGDVIDSVNDQPAAPLTLWQLSNTLRGEAGTKVSMSVARPGAPSPIKVEMRRARVEVPEVSWQMLPGQPRVAHLSFQRFTERSAEQVHEALAQLRRGGARGLVLDLRGNTGGLKEQAVKIAGEFLPRGELVMIQQDGTGGREEVPSPGGGGWTGPLVALVDGGTASSAEILAGALQDHERARLVGTRTYGTGTVLREYPLRDGSALLLAVAEWLTPNGRRIREQGIGPDAEVALPPEAMMALPDDSVPMTEARFAAMTDAQLRRGYQEAARMVQQND